MNFVIFVTRCNIYCLFGATKYCSSGWISLPTYVIQKLDYNGLKGVRLFYLVEYIDYGYCRFSKCVFYKKLIVKKLSISQRVG